MMYQNARPHSIHTVCRATLAVVLVAMAFPYATLTAQDEEGPFFEAQLQTYRPADEEKSGLKFHLSVKRDDLQFLKKNDAFEARFEVQIVLWDADSDDLVYDRSSSKSILLEHYDDTNKRGAFHDWSGTLEVAPGKYRVQALVTDLNTRQTRQREYDVDLQSYSEPGLKLGQVVFLSALEVALDGTKTLKAKVNNNISADDKEFLAYVEIYANEENSPITVTYNIRENVTENRRQLEQGTWTIFQHKKRDYIITNLVEFNLPIGAYRIIFEVEEDGVTKTSGANFTVELEGLPATITDLDRAIQQVRYIATKRELDALDKDKLENLDDRLKAFKQFWKMRDPTPLTEENERLIEYYQRAAYASRVFKVYRAGDGWKSDQGMVFMMYGPPDDIERRDMTDPNYVFFSSQRQFRNSQTGAYSYEAWYFFGNKYDPVVEFVDETNTGTFRLLNYTSVDQRTGFRGVLFDGRGSDMLLPINAKYPEEEEPDQDKEEADSDSKQKDS